MRPLWIQLLNDKFDTTIFSWLIPTPSLIYAAAILVALFAFMRRANKIDVKRYHAAGAALYIMIGGLLGARMVYLLFRWQDVLEHPSEILSPTGGTASWGGYLGGITGLLVYGWMNKIDHAHGSLALADVLASVLGLGIAIGRWACFLNGDDFGRLSDLPWAVSYPAGSLPYMAQITAGLLRPGAIQSLPVHPVQLYLSLNGLLLFIVFSLIWNRLKGQPGITFGLFWMAYGASRFLWEFTRGDQPDLVFGVFTIGQIVCIFLIGITPLYLLGLPKSKQNRWETN